MSNETTIEETYEIRILKESANGNKDTKPGFEKWTNSKIQATQLQPRIAELFSDLGLCHSFLSVSGFQVTDVTKVTLDDESDHYVLKFCAEFKALNEFPSASQKLSIDILRDNDRVNRNFFHFLSQICVDAREYILH
eukprot:m.338667 g.338667  ORF g.338667 m.338667 type:complete len:137 (+) comp18497_c0_seq1:261-671(+)